jgi:hypothetical protein
MSIVISLRNKTSISYKRTLLIRINRPWDYNFFNAPMRLFQGLAGRQPAQPAAQPRALELHEHNPADRRRYMLGGYDPLGADFMYGLGELVDRNGQVRGAQQPPAAQRDL